MPKNAPAGPFRVEHLLFADRGRLRPIEQYLVRKDLEGGAVLGSRGLLADLQERLENRQLRR